MKYKVGDRVRIAKDVKVGDVAGDVSFVPDMEEYRGTVMTISDVCNNEKYHMAEDGGKWGWRKEWIEGIAEEEPTNAEIFKLAISTYGKDEQIRMCHEEMDELGVALSKYHRSPCGYTLANVQEEIADVCIMMQQAKTMFGEKEVDEIIQQKIERLKNNLDDEQEIEIVIGVHKLGGISYVWQNPEKYHVEVGCLAIADTKYGEQPIIVEEITVEKKKDVKQYKCITRGIRK